VKEGRYNEVLITRATVPMGEEIGFLPGTELEKMDPWIGGTLRDVYTVLGLNDPKDPLRQKVEVASMSFMRGRSFQGKFIIIDEAQNLTINQMRALLTRAGEGSKVVLTGNLSQIDSPYIDEGSSGLAWAVKTMQDWPHAGSLILTRGERSRLATYVEEAASRASREKEGGLLAA
jgi:PhoH-like ATPase